MRMGTGSGYRVEAGRRLRRAVADSDGSRGDSEGERTGDPPETVTRQEFQGVVKRVRRLATAHNGCEERLEELEAWQDYQVQPTNAHPGYRIDTTYLHPVHF